MKPGSEEAVDQDQQQTLGPYLEELFDFPSRPHKEQPADEPAETPVETEVALEPKQHLSQQQLVVNLPENLRYLNLPMIPNLNRAEGPCKTVQRDFEKGFCKHHGAGLLPGSVKSGNKLLGMEEEHGKLQVTMQSSSAEVTMMESQNRKRAPAWTEREVRDLITLWGDKSVLSELCSSFRNAKTFVKISQSMKGRGHNRDPKQCRVKLKELRKAYQKTREANGHSGSEPKTCRFYDELHAILGGSATTTPAVLFDSFNGDGGNMEADFGDEEDDEEEEVVDSSPQTSGETGFPDSQERFLILDLEPVPREPTQGCLLDPPGGEGTSGERTF
ncbi:Zinc finger and SCAN domain-containing protein 29 [Chelonia mydas]|uniref:Zinc finger and SCAN domain-containing protein 29 n=1 Tax=Chelonia mydas TaxID=8469 RepID=M7AYS7_CHEMY|nr:Zinc finger and SCAN domain-containing protein 29 [Chelonia mydas]